MFQNEDFLNNISKIYIKQDKSYVIDYNNILIHIPDNDEFKKEYDLINNYVENNKINCSEYDEYKYINNHSEKSARATRDRLLADADNMLVRYQEQVELKIISANDIYRNELLQYKQALRDIPEQKGFPNNISYPELPKYEDYIK